MQVHLDPAMPVLVGSLLGILLVGLILARFRQPQVVGYILSGVILGPHVFGVVSDSVTLSRLGSQGVVLLLFFVGMEISPRRLIANWKVSVGGTFFQILISVGLVWLLGHLFGWSLGRIVLIGFVISLSSTAVVLKLLQDWRETDSDVGQDVLGILLVQDLALIPMMIILGLMSETGVATGGIALQVIGGSFILMLMFLIVREKPLVLPFAKYLKKDHEIEVFSALLICLGLAFLTGLFQLSTALGAFIAGMLIAKAKETQWVHQRLESFRVVFVAMFFVSIGMLVDLNFLISHLWQILLLLLLVLVTNTFINACILRISGDPWKDSLYAGAMLSQIGEFSFVLTAIGLQIGLITNGGYQMSIAVISLSLLFSPLWILMVRRWMNLPAQVPG